MQLLDVPGRPALRGTRLKARRCRGQRGAVIVEAAFVLPVMLTLVIGIIEFGLLFSNYSTANAATRSGARVAAAMYSQAPAGPSETAGQTDAINQIVDAVSADLQVMNNAVPVGMAIYRVNTANTDGAPTGGFPGTNLVGGCTNRCIRFTWNGHKMVRQSMAQQWPDPVRCGLPENVESIGIFVQVKHTYITGMFGHNKTVNAHTVMRLEPVPSDSC